MTKAEILDAIRAHGAQAVYEAAHRHMAGDRTRGLTTVGLAPDTMRDVYDALSEAHQQLGPAAQTIEQARTQAALDQVAARRGAAE